MDTLTLPPRHTPIRHPAAQPLVHPPQIDPSCVLALLPIEGDKWVDYSGHGNHGAVTGATKTAKGRKGFAWYFDGVDDYVDCGDDGSLAITDGITLVAWVKTVAGAGGANTFFLFKGPLTNNFGNYELGSEANGIVATFYLNNHAASLDVSITADVWHHIAGTYDKETMRLYVDNVEKDSTPYSQDIASSDTSLLLAKGYSEAQARFKGSMDGALVFNRALAADEIAALYEQGRP